MILDNDDDCQVLSLHVRLFIKGRGSNTVCLIDLLEKLQNLKDALKFFSFITERWTYSPSSKEKFLEREREFEFS